MSGTTAATTVTLACPLPTIKYGNVQETGSPQTAWITCAAGYSLDGSKMLTCNNGSWVGTIPVCVYNYHPVYNDIDIHNKGVQNWLALLLGILAGVGALLLLACLLYYCLRWCGCISGPFFGCCGGQVSPEYAEQGACCSCCGQRRRRIKERRSYHDSRTGSLVDLEENVYVMPNNRKKKSQVVVRKSEEFHENRVQNHQPPPNVLYSEKVVRTRNQGHNGYPPLDHQVHETRNSRRLPPQNGDSDDDDVPKIQREQKVYTIHHHHMSSDSGMSSSRTNDSPSVYRDVIEKDKKRKPAKLPLWMPHSHPIRNINTSTK